MSLQPRLIGILVLAALLMLPAAALRAEEPSMNMIADAPKDPELEAKRSQIDQAYQSATKKIPQQQAADPWGNIRGNEPAKDPGKPAAPPKKQAGAK
jgi:hypothetical protein